MYAQFVCCLVLLLVGLGFRPSSGQDKKVIAISIVQPSLSERGTAWEAVLNSWI